MSRLDPKPGRWILPLVVSGIVAFTWVFVNALSPSYDATTDDLSTAATTEPADSTTTTEASATTTTTTTTTIPPEIAQFVLAADTVEAAANELLLEAQGINDTWEELRNFTLAINSLRDLADRTEAFSEGVSSTSVPDALVEAWQPAEEAAGAMVLASKDMVRGLQAPDTGQIRRAALADLATAVADLSLAVTNAKAVTSS